MYSEEIFTKMTKYHMKRCYRALILADKMMELYQKRVNMPAPIWPEDLEEPDEEFREIMEEYIKGADDGE